MAKAKAKLKASTKRPVGGYKIKTKRAAAKRYKVLGSGKIKVAKCNRRHNTGPKSRKLKNKLRRGQIMREESMLHVYRCLPNSF